MAFLFDVGLLASESISLVSSVFSSVGLYGLLGLTITIAWFCLATELEPPCSLPSHMPNLIWLFISSSWSTMVFPAEHSCSIFSSIKLGFELTSLLSMGLNCVFDFVFILSGSPLGAEVFNFSLNFYCGEESWFPLRKVYIEDFLARCSLVFSSTFGTYLGLSNLEYICLIDEASRAYTA